jgi:hypothetical protein
MDELMQHEAGEGQDMQAGQDAGQALRDAGQAAEAGGPGAAALHHPAARHADAAARGVGQLNDREVDAPRGRHRCHRCPRRADGALLDAGRDRDVRRGHGLHRRGQRRDLGALIRALAGGTTSASRWPNGSPAACTWEPVRRVCPL